MLSEFMLPEYLTVASVLSLAALTISLAIKAYRQTRRADEYREMLMDAMTGKKPRPKDAPPDEEEAHRVIKELRDEISTKVAMSIQVHAKYEEAERDFKNHLASKDGTINTLAEKIIGLETTSLLFKKQQLTLIKLSQFLVTNFPNEVRPNEDTADFAIRVFKDLGLDLLKVMDPPKWGKPDLWKDHCSECGSHMSVTPLRPCDECEAFHCLECLDLLKHEAGKGPPVCTIVGCGRTKAPEAINANGKLNTRWCEQHKNYLPPHLRQRKGQVA